jgi:hypothetical protein
MGPPEGRLWRVQIETTAGATFGLMGDEGWAFFEAVVDSWMPQPSTEGRDCLPMLSNHRVLSQYSLWLPRPGINAGAVR